MTEVWSLHELAIKAAPLILIAVGLSVCYRSNNWNIGAEGQFIMGAIAGSILPVVLYEWQSPLVLPLMMLLGMLGGALFAGIPAFLKAHLNTNEILTSLMLVYVAQLFSRLAGARTLAQSRRHEFSGNPHLRRNRHPAGNDRVRTRALGASALRSSPRS